MPRKRDKSQITKPSWLKCPVCEVGFCYYKAKTNSFQCRKCGTQFRANWARKCCEGIPEAEL